MNSKSQETPETLLCHRKEVLYEICRRFVQDNKISSPESIYQCDWIIENAYELLENICDMVGYYEEQDD